MQEWDEGSEQVSRIAADKEKAKALLEVIKLREKSLGLMKSDEFSTLIVEGYYEIIKELITALMSIDGWKTLGHEMLVGYLAKFYKDFSQAEISIIDLLRKTRNDIAYRGVTIRPEYFTRNKPAIIAIIEKLRHIVLKKL